MLGHSIVADGWYEQKHPTPCDWFCVFMQHIFKLPYVVRWLNTGLYFIWPKYQHSNHMLMSSYVDCQCFRFYLREDSSLIINPQSMQYVSTFSVFGLRKASILIISLIRIFFCHINCTSIFSWSALTMTTGKCAFETIFAASTSCRSAICGTITLNDF